MRLGCSSGARRLTDAHSLGQTVAGSRGGGPGIDSPGPASQFAPPRFLNLHRLGSKLTPPQAALNQEGGFTIMTEGDPGLEGRQGSREGREGGLRRPIMVPGPWCAAACSPQFHGLALE